MSGGRVRAPEILGDIAAKDLFPDVVTRQEMLETIRSSENKLKFWAVAALLSHLILALPIIFYMGKVAQSIQEVSSSVQELQTTQKASNDWIRDRMVWEAKIESALRDKGVNVQ